MKQKNSSPDFLVIGAQKAGTTWLYEQLSSHNEIFIPPVKEVHYFDRDISYNSPSRLALASVQDRITSDSSSAQEWRKHLMQHIRSSEREDVFNSKWYLNYLFGHYDDRWYKSLFADRTKRIHGDITPAYSILKTSDIKKIKQMFPEIKIIFLMRNPVERDWSHFKYDCKLRNINPTNVSLNNILSFMNCDGVRARSDYLKIINKWSHFFSADRCFIGYYDEIKDSPKKLLNKIYSFLDLKIQPENLNQEKIYTKYNKSYNTKIPQEVEIELIKMHIDRLKKLSEFFGTYTTQWLINTQKKLPVKTKVIT